MICCVRMGEPLWLLIATKNRVKTMFVVTQHSASEPCFRLLVFIDAASLNVNKNKKEDRPGFCGAMIQSHIKAAPTSSGTL